MATLKKQYLDWLKENDPIFITYDVWLRDVLGKQLEHFIPIVSDDFQIGPDGAYEHGEE